jgi:hypothetical protein
MDWHEAGSLQNLAETNEQVLEYLHALVKQESGTEPLSFPSTIRRTHDVRIT